MKEEGNGAAPPVLEDLGRTLIVGVTSAIARATAAEFAARGHDLVVTGRNQEELDAVAADLALRHGIEVEGHLFDALDFESHDALLKTAQDGGLRGAVVALGYLGDQAGAQRDFNEARRIVDTSYTACVSLLEKAASILEEQGVLP